MSAKQFDVVVVGSGAAALGAAATASASGLSTLIVEKSRYWGGTTSYSGGGMWIPANPLLVADGCADSAEEGLRYLDEIVGDVGPCSSQERRNAFLRNGPLAITFLIAQGLRVQRTPRYPDYYPDKPGGKIGRQLEPSVFDGRALGPLLATLRRPPGAPPYLTQIDDFDRLTMPFHTVSGFLRGVRLMARTASWRARRTVPLTLGPSLVAQLMAIAQRHGAEVWVESPFRELVLDGDRVTGVVVEHGGERVQVHAARGVVLAAGGFARSAELRRQYQPVNGDWSSAVGADTGDAIVAATAHGAATALMDDAWWGASFVTEGRAAGFCLWERSLPGSIIVGSDGRRFANESTSYVDFGHAQLERGTVPAWLVLDGRHRKHYLFMQMFPRRTPQSAIDSGFLVKAESLQELATKTGIDEAGLLGTVERFNGFAASGVDEDFGRGRTVYDNYYGDPRVKPNPNLGPISKPPFWATKIYPGDLGTKGGLLTDERARVVREDGSLIAGLYASGNTTASVMGRTYPGPGGTLGPAVVFGYVAARDLAATA